MTDIAGKVVARIRNARLELLMRLSNLRMKPALMLKGIQWGKGIRFWGTACMVRHPESIIRIGNFCSFRSDGNSNLIGVNRKCIVSTHSKGAEISIGDQCGFSGAVIGAKEKIVIGNHVLLGANTLITDFDWHGIAPDKRNSYSGDSKPVSIGNNVFIGYGAIVLKGVTIGDNSVIGANSVVTKNIPANVIASGNPCKIVKELL